MNSLIMLYGSAWGWAPDGATTGRAALGCVIIAFGLGLLVYGLWPEKKQ